MSVAFATTKPKMTAAQTIAKLESELAEARREISDIRHDQLEEEVERSERYRFAEVYIDYLDTLAQMGFADICDGLVDSDDQRECITQGLEREHIVNRDGELSVSMAGHVWLSNQPRGWRIESLRIAKTARPAIAVTEYVTRMSYTPNEAEAEKLHIDDAREERMITAAQASKFKAWVTRRTVTK